MRKQSEPLESMHAQPRGLQADTSAVAVAEHCSFIDDLSSKERIFNGQNKTKGQGGDCHVAPIFPIPKAGRSLVSITPIPQHTVTLVKIQASGFWIPAE